MKRLITYFNKLHAQILILYKIIMSYFIQIIGQNRTPDINMPSDGQFYPLAIVLQIIFALP